MEEQAKSLFSDSGDTGLANGLVDQGRLFYHQGEFDEALSCLRRAYERSKTDGDHGQTAEIANDIGVVYTVLEQWGEAERWIHEAHELFVRAQDYRGEAQTLGNLGSMFRDRGDLKQAAASLQLAADRFHLIGDDECRWATLRVLSRVRLRQFRFLQALAAYEAALACHPRPTTLHRFLRKLFALPLRMLGG